MRILILADIHANLSAFCAVLTDAKKHEPQAAVFLGDLIDYGMRPNEVIDQMGNIPMPLLCALRGNHEQALLCQDTSRFSTDRGVAMSQYTRALITAESRNFLMGLNAAGYAEITIDKTHILLIHGNIEDPFWGTIKPGNISDKYKEYDIVLSAHSHRPHSFEGYFVDADSPYRGEKKTIFINPGSVGQPRNHNPRAQYAVIDTKSKEVFLTSASYPVQKEQDLFPPELPLFYRERLAIGI